MKKVILSLALVFALIFNADAITVDSVRFHSQDTDTARIIELLDATRTAQCNSSAERISFIARQFLGTPYVAATLEGSPEMLTINTGQLDCTTFVETVIALALTAVVDSATYLDFIDNLADLRYRNGIIDGYASRLHYVSEWILQNSQRGIFTEITAQNPKVAYRNCRLNYMSKHRSSYDALAYDNETFNAILEVEKKYFDYKMPYIPKAVLALPPAQKWLQNGDIVFITTSTAGLDVSHMGIVVFQRGVPHLLHASSKAKKVVIDSQPLHNYLQASKSATGIRVVRFN